MSGEEGDRLMVLWLNASVPKYKADLNIKFKFVCITVCPLVMSPFSHDLLRLIIIIIEVFKVF